MSDPQQTIGAVYGTRRFRIVQDLRAGFYLYVYDGARCTHDYLQDTLREAQEFACETFGVPLQNWSPDDTIETAQH